MENLIKEYNLNYKKFYPMIYNIIFRKIQLKEDTEDLCQEIFLVYYKSLNKIKIKNIKNWLYGTMLHHLKKYYKKQKIYFLNIDDLYEHKSLSYVNNHEINILINDNVINDKILHTLDERETFKLIGFSGATFKETALKLGLTMRQIRYQYQLILRRIRYNFQCIGIYNLDDLIW